jgi:hypothetical protein
MRTAHPLSDLHIELSSQELFRCNGGKQETRIAVGNIKRAALRHGPPAPPQPVTSEILSWRNVNSEVSGTPTGLVWSLVSSPLMSVRSSRPDPL